jgi:hypothetical protein
MEDLKKEIKSLDYENKKRKERDADDRKWNKKGCESQFKFNIKVGDNFDKVTAELGEIFHSRLEVDIPFTLAELVKEGKQLVSDRNHDLKIADEYGWEGLEVFKGEELARNEKEEKKLAQLKKQMKEKKSSWNTGKEAPRKHFQDRKGRGSDLSRGGQGDRGGAAGRRPNVQCNTCAGWGHFARDCYTGSSQKSGRGRDNGGGERPRGGGKRRY